MIQEILTLKKILQMTQESSASQTYRNEGLFVQLLEQRDPGSCLHCSTACCNPNGIKHQQDRVEVFQALN